MFTFHVDHLGHRYSDLWMRAFRYSNDSHTTFATLDGELQPSGVDSADILANRRTRITVKIGPRQ